MHSGLAVVVGAALAALGLLLLLVWYYGDTRPAAPAPPGPSRPTADGPAWAAAVGSGPRSSPLPRWDPALVGTLGRWAAAMGDPLGMAAVGGPAPGALGPRPSAGMVSVGPAASVAAPEEVGRARLAQTPPGSHLWGTIPGRVGIFPGQFLGCWQGEAGRLVGPGAVARPVRTDPECAGQAIEAGRDAFALDRNPGGECWLLAPGDPPERLVGASPGAVPDCSSGVALYTVEPSPMCFPTPGYRCLRGRAQGSADDDALAQRPGLRPSDLADACNRTEGCRAFTTDGWLKRAGEPVPSRTGTLYVHDGTPSAAPCAAVPGYLCVPMTDRPGDDLAQSVLRAPADLARECDSRTGCRGFNTDGWLKASTDDGRRPTRLLNLYVRDPSQRPAPAACEAVPGYTCLPRTDSPGEPENDWYQSPAASVAEFAAACNRMGADCGAFNTAGWLKSSGAVRVPWDGGNLYVKG